MNGAGLFGMPIVSSTLPSVEHLRTVWVAVIGAIEMVVTVDVQAMGAVEHPSPQLVMKLPSRSSTTIGWAPRLNT